MIREMMQNDICDVMTIWMETNIKTHDFISPDYWKRNYTDVEQMLPEAEVYVYEREAHILGFVGLMENYVAGIFVKGEYQSEGIGKALLDYVKGLKEELTLHVYKKNIRAMAFYKREGFLIIKELMEKENKESEYEMHWNGKKM